MTAAPRADTLAEEIDEALALLSDYRQPGDGAVPADPLPSLLQEARALCADFPPAEPVRTLHHFACTGGTLLAKCIASLPNVILLSEIDPLSRLGVIRPDRKPAFAPTDLFLPLLQSLHGVSDSVIVGAFQAAIAATTAGLARHGQRLVLRDHSHSQFCTAADADQRPTLHDMLHQSGPVLSLVTVRHPLDSFIGLDRNRWAHFQPFTLEEYSRRYLRFLDRHAQLPVLKYEDFVQDPATGLQRICTVLALPYTPLALDLISAMPLSGDSGRAGAVIAPRERRPVPDVIEAQRNAAGYTGLCQRLGYEP